MTFPSSLFQAMAAGLITASLAFPCCAEVIIQHSHVSSLESFQFTQDGRFLVTAARDGEVLLWDVATGKLLRELRPVREWPGGYGAAFDLSGSRILICDSDGTGTTIQLLDLETGQSLRVLTPPKQVSIQKPQFSRDGRFIFVAARSKQAQGLLGWEAESGDLILKLEPSNSELNDRVAKLMKQFDSVPRKPPWVTGDILECLVILKKALQDRGESLADNILIGEAIGVRFSPNGRIAVCNDWNDTGSPDEDVSVWDFESCRLLHSFMEPYRYLEHVLFSSDGQYFLVGHLRDKLQVRSSKTGDLIRELVHPKGKIMAMAMSPKDQWIAIGGADGLVAIWNASDGTSLCQLLSEGEVTSIAFSPDAQSMAVARKDHATVVYATQDWRPVCEVSDATAIVQFSPDSRRLLVANKNRRFGITNVALFALPSGEKIGAIAEPPICDLLISPDGNWALGVPTTDRYFRNRALVQLPLWNTRTGELLHQFKADTFFLEHPGNWARKSAVPGGLIQSTPIRSAATLGPWETPTPWSHTAWRALRYEPHLRQAAEDVLSKIRELDDPGRQWLEGMLEERAVDTGPVEQPRLFFTRKSDEALRLAAWSRRLEGNRVVAVRDRAGNIIREFSDPKKVPFTATLSSDGRQLWVGYRSPKYGYLSTSVIGWQIETGRKIHVISAPQISSEPGHAAKGLILSPDDRYLLTSYARHPVIYDLKNQARRLTIGGDRISEIQFSPDSKSIFCFGKKRTLWSLEKRKQLALFGSYSMVGPPVYSSEGRYLIVQTTGGGAGAKLWDAHTGQAVQEFRQELRFAFSPTGDRFVSWSSGRRVASHLWNFENGRMLADLSTELGPGCRAVCFSPDGKLLMTHHFQSNRHDVIGFWNAKSGEKIRRQSIPDLVNGPRSKSFFVDNARYVTVQHAGAQLWDAQRGLLLHRFETKLHRSNRAVLSPGKSELLIITPGKHGTLWDMASGEQKQVFEGMRGNVKFTSNQQLLLEHCRNGQLVKIWDVASGQLLRQIHSSRNGQKLLVE